MRTTKPDINVVDRAEGDGGRPGVYALAVDVKGGSSGGEVVGDSNVRLLADPQRMLCADCV